MPKTFENALKISSFWEVYLRKYNKSKKSEGSYVLELIISEYVKMKVLPEFELHIIWEFRNWLLLLLKENLKKPIKPFTMAPWAKFHFICENPSVMASLVNLWSVS